MIGLIGQRMACGNCGHGAFSLYVDNKFGRSRYFSMCQQCKAISTFDVSSPEVKIGWHKTNDKGIPCPMEPVTGL